MLLRNILLATHSNYKIGGPAKYFFEAKNSEQVIKILEKWRRLAQRQSAGFNANVFILGGGTNILFNDVGFSGLVLKPALNYIKQRGNLVAAGSGTLVADLLEFCADKGLSGLEWAGGLPGFVGGAVRGNAGAFKGEIKDSVVEVISLDFFGSLFGGKPKIIKRNNKQCFFDYRDSVFKRAQSFNHGLAKTAGINIPEIILEATFQLRLGNKKDIKQAIEDKIQWRESRQPIDYPNIGSIFKNIPVSDFRRRMPDFGCDIISHVKTDPFPVLPAATLIDKCGLKGVSCGGAMVSQKHPNFIVNCGAATANDVRALVALVKSSVHKKFKVKLEEEVVLM